MATAVEQLLTAKREDILRIAAQHGARNVRVFGSTARGEATETSDIDLLVDMAPGRSLFDMIDLQFELQDLLGRPVDLVTENGLYWLLRRKILRETQPL